MDVYRLFALLLIYLAVTLVNAETGYVTDRLFAELHADPDLRSPVVAALSAGTELEVFASRGGFTEVAKGDRRGWIDTELLLSERPTGALLPQLREEAERLRTELAYERAARARISMRVMMATAIGALLIGFGLGILWRDHRLQSRFRGERI